MEVSAVERASVEQYDSRRTRSAARSMQAESTLVAAVFGHQRAQSIEQVGHLMWYILKGLSRSYDARVLGIINIRIAE